MSSSRRATLIVAIVLGLSAYCNNPLKASQASPGPSNQGSSPKGSDDLSQKLNHGDGVISPPRQVDPGMNVKPPSDAGSMRIIPPPGSPGRNPNVQPK
jgi:hypothetical protein